MKLKQEYNVERLWSLSKLVSVYNMGQNNNSVAGDISPQDYNLAIATKIKLDKPDSLSKIIRDKDKNALIKYKQYIQVVLVNAGIECDYEEFGISIKACIYNDDELWEELKLDLQHISGLENVRNFNMEDMSILLLSRATFRYV